MDLYAETILEHHRHPRCKGSVKHPTVAHAESNPACGDAIELQLKIEGGTVTTAGWNGSGCALSQAGISMLLERLSGKTLHEAETFSPKDMRLLLGVPLTTRRLQCAFLPLLALRNALRKRDDKPLLTWAELLEEDR